MGSLNQSVVSLGKFCKTLTPLGLRRGGKILLSKNKLPYTWKLLYILYWIFQYTKTDEHRFKLPILLRQPEIQAIYLK